MPSPNGHLDYEDVGEDFYNYAFKIMLVGDSCVGKTCLLIRFKDNAFLHNNFIATVGMDYRNKTLNLDGVKVKLQIWDTAGQERFRSLTHTYYRDADAILLVFDLSNRSTFEHVKVCKFSNQMQNAVISAARVAQIKSTKKSVDLETRKKNFSQHKFILDDTPFGSWLADVEKYAKNDILVYMVGNKADLVSQRQIKTEEAKKLAEEYSLPFAETSGKTGMNVEHVFRTIAHELAKRKAGKVVTEKGIDLGVVDEASAKKWACSC